MTANTERFPPEPDPWAYREDVAKLLKELQQNMRTCEEGPAEIGATD